ncbi:hypothetical protein EW146_g8222 [Bondarzewia mesenterica]|uniref:Uncharacterized protein n=1 Tax=Bondarzewia mesenterica TaxID=1095465 RepID=A0A4S4LGB7_9AGAM|nr:hypothetical protein EW146_g8222 [Bondarzewia mesenterica]
MLSFTRLTLFAALALAASANPLGAITARTSSTCTTVKTTDVTVGSNTVVLSSLSCDSTASVTLAPVAAATNDTNVCGEICNTFCSGQGSLPPITQDCQVITEAITLFEGNQSPTFTVQPFHIVQLVFGTCRFFFENLSGAPIDYCWQDLSNTGSAVATTCFPPTQPVESLAECKSPDGTWELGVSHSNNTSS